MYVYNERTRERRIAREEVKVYSTRPYLLPTLSGMKRSSRRRRRTLTSALSP